MRNFYSGVYSLPPATTLSDLWTCTVIVPPCSGAAKRTLSFFAVYQRNFCSSSSSSSVGGRPVASTKQYLNTQAASSPLSHKKLSSNFFMASPNVMVSFSAFKITGGTGLSCDAEGAKGRPGQAWSMTVETTNDAQTSSLAGGAVSSAVPFFKLPPCRPVA